MALAGCIPTVAKVFMPKLPVASALIALNPRQPAKRIDLLIRLVATP